MDIVADDSVTLGEAANDFQSIVAVDTTADAITLVDIDDILLGNIDGSTLSIDAGGMIDQVAGTSIVATGTAELRAVTNIDLIETDNDFQDVVDAFGVDIALYDTDDIVLGSVEGTNLDVNAGGTITDDSVSGSVADAVSVSGDTTLVASGIIERDDPNQDFTVVPGSAGSGGAAPWGWGRGACGPVTATPALMGPGHAVPYGSRLIEEAAIVHTRRGGQGAPYCPFCDPDSPLHGELH